MDLFDFREEFRRFLMNYSAPCEKDEMTLFIREEFRRFLMKAYDREFIEEFRRFLMGYNPRVVMRLDLLSVLRIEEFLRLLMGNNPRAVMEKFLRLLMGNYPRAVKEELCRLLMEFYDRRFIVNEIFRMVMAGLNIQLETLELLLDWETKEDLFKIATTKAEETNDLFKMVTTKAEKTNVLSQQVYELKEIFEKSRDEIKLCKETIDEIEKREYREASHIADACCQVLRFILAAIDEWLESRMQLLIVLLAVLLLGNNDDRKRLVRPERGKISCITVYLLGNDGAHSYNGNGIRFTKTIKYVRLTNEELVDQRGHGKPPIDVRLREPTNREIAKIARKIGREYVSLAILLGFTKAELDHFREDHRFTEHRVFEMLFKWRETKESNATIEKLTDALEELGINADIIYSSLD